MNVDILRKNGYGVRVCHLRRVLIPVATTKGIKTNEMLLSRSEIEELSARKMVHHVSNVGGFTRVEITDKDGNIYNGVSESKHEPFNRKLGLRIALGRAMSKIRNVVTV